MNENKQLEKIDENCINYKYAYNTQYNKFIKLGDWLKKESIIFKNESNNKIYNKLNFRQGEIIKIDFGINVGSELSNTHFAIVLNSDDNNNVDNIIVLPLTSKPGYKRISIGNILKPFIKDSKYNKNSYALITKITTISKKKIFKDNIRCHSDKNIFDKLIQEVINFLTK